MPRSSRVPGCCCASITTAPAPSPNSTQVPRSVQSRMREKVSAPITSARLCTPGAQQAVGGRHARRRSPSTPPADRTPRRDGCRARPGSRPRSPERCCPASRSPTTIRSIACASTPACASAARAAAIAEVGGHLAVGRDVALADAGALHDPLVGGVDHPRQFGVGEDALRQIAAAAEDDGTCDSHEAASTLPAAASSLAWRTSVSLILLSSS